MSNKISLLEAIGIPIEKKEGAKEPEDAFFRKYLKGLQQFAGSKSAIDIVQKYSLEDLLRGQEILDKFDFRNPPKTAKGKLKQVLKFLEWDSQLENFDGRDYYLENITTTFHGFKKINEKLLSYDNKTVKGWFFFRDVLTGVPRELLEKYGVPVTKDNRKFHIGTEYDHSKAKALPGITTDELIDFLAVKEIEGNGVDEYAITQGFDDCFAAMEAASKTGEKRDAYLYAKLGFTSYEKVKEIDIEKLRQLKKSFDFTGICHHYDKLFGRFVGEYIKGRTERLDEMLKLAEKKGSSDYLKAFDGSVLQVRRTFNLPEEERPSARSIEYVRNNFSIFDFKDVIAAATEIDSPYSLIFRQEFDNKEDLIAFKSEYEEKLRAYQEVIGKKPKLDYHDYKRLKEFDGDIRFLMDFGLYDLNRANKVGEAMDFETYDAIKIDSPQKGYMVSSLLEKGYNTGDITDALSGETVNQKDFVRALTFFSSDSVGLKDIVKIAQTGVDAKYAQEMLHEVSFIKENLLYSLLSGLEANEVSPQQLRTFGETVRFNKYISELGFDAVSLLNDLNVFYNKNKIIKD